MHRRTLLAATLVAGCAASTPAPVEFRVDRPAPPTAAIEPPSVKTAPAAPVEFRGGRPADPLANSDTPTWPQSVAGEDRAATPPAAAPVDAMPAPGPMAQSPNWATRPGASLADFALRPEEARPFNPKSPPATHVVAAGETVNTIGARYSTPLRALIEANALPAPFTLAPGQVLQIPRPRLHTVRPGETLLSLARTYRIDVRSLALLNGLKAPYQVAAGDELVLPVGARGALASHGDPSAANPAPAPEPATRAGSADQFVWPVRGAVVARFGPGAHGRRLDGIEIAAKPGEVFRASRDGRVVYAGADLPGYGHLVLIQHADRWVTAYARAGRLQVTEGDQVRRGDALGVVGGAGAAASAGRLHFQLRRGREAVDPLRYLPAA